MIVRNELNFDINFSPVGVFSIEPRPPEHPTSHFRPRPRPIPPPEPKPKWKSDRPQQQAPPSLRSGATLSTNSSITSSGLVRNYAVIMTATNNFPNVKKPQ